MFEIKARVAACMYFQLCFFLFFLKFFASGASQRFVYCKLPSQESIGMLHFADGQPCHIIKSFSHNKKLLGVFRPFNGAR